MTKYNQKQTFSLDCERYFLESCFQLCGDFYSPKQRTKQAFFSIPGMRGMYGKVDLLNMAVDVRSSEIGLTAEPQNHYVITL